MNKKNIIKIINKELIILKDFVDGMTEEGTIQTIEVEMALSKTQDIYNVLKLLKDSNVNAVFEKYSTPTIEKQPVTNIPEASATEKITPTVIERKLYKEEEINANKEKEIHKSEDQVQNMEHVDELVKDITIETPQNIVEIEIPEEELVIEDSVNETGAEAITEPTIVKSTEVITTSERLKNEILADKFPEQRISINDMLSSFKQDKNIAALLKDRPVRDLKKAVKINDRIWYIKELFNNDSEKYNINIELLNQLDNLDQALAHIFTNFEWDQNKKSTISFLELIYRRFSNNQ